MNPLSLVAAGLSIFGGLSSSSASSAAGNAARDAAYANAEEALRLSQLNAAMATQIAGINAAAIRNVGYANAQIIERTAFRNGTLMMVEGAELMRRHVREEQYMVGQIRAIQAATGWSVNEGTPREYKEAQKAEMYREREFIATQQKLSLFTMLMDAADQAAIARYAADQQSSALLLSAELEREILLAEGLAIYNQLIREGDLLAAQGNAISDRDIFGTALDVLGIFI